MNSQTKKDIPCFRSYLPDALRLRFEDKLTIRAIAQRLGLSHSTIHTLFQRFIASGIAWPLPDSVSLAQLDAISAKAHGEKNGEPATAVNLRSVWLSRHYSPVLLLPGSPESTVSMITCCLNGKASTRTAY